MAVTPALGERTQTLTFDALGTALALAVVGPADLGRAALGLARAAVEGVAAACAPTPAGPLGAVNADPDEWHVVPTPLYLALERAARAYALTDGLTDPRVRVGMGTALAEGAAWRPAFEPERLAVRLGGAPVDLAAPARALAVDLASAALAGAGDVHLVDAGSECRFAGPGQDGDGWRVTVDDPVGAAGPLAVLRADDRAVATASGGPAALAATVLARETSTAQAWSRALLVAGADEAPALAAAHELAALWVDEARCLHVTPEAAAHVLWLAPGVDVRDGA